MKAPAAVIDIDIEALRMWSTSMIYDYPQYYEIAFSFRDIPREAA
jgi:hypothetical protein